MILRKWKYPKQIGFEAATSSQCGICHKLITKGQRVYQFTTNEQAHVDCGLGSTASGVSPTVTLLGKGSGKYRRY